MHNAMFGNAMFGNARRKDAEDAEFVFEHFLCALGECRATYGDEVQPGSRKAGVFWHTQGSGKGISMCCYAGKLLPRR